MKIFLRPLAALLPLAFLLSACAGGGSSGVPSGYVYTTLNGEGENAVVRFTRMTDGTLDKEKSFPTGSQGGANRGAGGDAYGDFDSQNAVSIIGDYLLAVNAGGNDVSVFKIDRATGDLTHVANVASGGARPVTLTTQPVAGEDGMHWVVVGNQWNNPNVQKGGDGEAPIERYPHDEFIASGHEEINLDRNISVFTFDANTGKLVFDYLADSYVGTNGGPTTIDFSPDGTKLVVATWGIAHFGTATPSLDEQKPSRVYVYDFSAEDGDVSNSRFYEEAGVAGSIGLDWSPNSEFVYVTNFNLTVDTRDHSVTVLAATADAVNKVQNFGTGDGADVDEACWMLVSPDGTKAYASSFGTNVISVFNIEADGTLSTIGPDTETAYANRAEGTPAGDTKDMYIVGTDFYIIGAYQTYTMSHYRIGADGTLTLIKEYDVATATGDQGPGTYNFLGLAGYELSN